MSILTNLREVFFPTASNFPSNKFLLKESDSYINYMKKPIYMANLEKNKKSIEHDFVEHSGYFSKLSDANNNVFGFIFRCVFKDYTFTDSNNITHTIPYFVVCHFQPVINDVTIDQIKLLGKSKVLTSGERLIKQYVKNNKIIQFDNGTSIFKEVQDIFPVYKDLQNHDYESYFDSSVMEIFEQFDETTYNDIVEYIYSFESKVFKYFTDVNERDIYIMWVK